MTTSSQKFLGLTRLGLGLIFLWAFFDKLLGWNFSTPPGQAWIHGVSPTFGYLSFATHGPLAGFFQSLAGNPLIDVLFMLGLLGVGTALTFGIKIKLASLTGATMLTLMYISALPPEHHPFLDEHIIYILILLSFTQIPVGEWFGFGKWWSQQKLIKQYPILK
jgi:thiosulfate dehydrogenase [quinone] large subunit